MYRIDVATVVRSCHRVTLCPYPSTASSKMTSVEVAFGIRTVSIITDPATVKSLVHCGAVERRPLLQ